MSNTKQQHAQALPGPGWSLLIFIFVLIAAGLSTRAAATPTASQSVPLKAGWNAIWLEVEPVGEDGLRRSPEAVFANTAIEIVATPKPLAGTSTFFSGASTGLGDDASPNDTDFEDDSSKFNEGGWQQWKRTTEGTNNLALISGNRPYLVKVADGTPDFALNLTGKVRFFRPEWVPDRYNLLGFGLEGSPTFDAFFGPSGTKHEVHKIFTLMPSGEWKSVNTEPTPTNMVSGRAYWIYSSGPSDYMGPVAVDFRHSVTGRLGYGGPGDALPIYALDAADDAVPSLELDLAELTFTNLGSADAIPELDLRDFDGYEPGLNLQIVNPASNSLRRELGGQVDSSPATGGSAQLGESIISGETETHTLGAQRSWTSGSPTRTNLYRLDTGGASFWLPVTAAHSDLRSPTDLSPVEDLDNVAGLWVGEVIIDSVTSIVEDGAPVRPASGAAPLRIILHSDVAGSVRLLNQVTLMQTKGANTSGPDSDFPDQGPSPVLVIDPAQIPFFEGIKERNGKKVGIRIQTVGYDMPRKIDGESQEELLNATVLGSESDTNPEGTLLYPDLNTIGETGIADFLRSRSSRPPTLAEAYELSIAMTGAVGPGKTVNTTLTLDPFHRSNPFRHAFHKQQARGPMITREMEIVFDPEQTLTDRLRGSFTETIQGLMQSNLVFAGRVEMRRVSSVDILIPTK